jgi:hypothetical protein
LGNAGLQGGGRIGRKLVTPEVVDQGRRRHRPAGVQQQVGQQRADLAIGDPYRRSVVGPGRDRTEHAESHLLTLEARNRF